MNAILHIKFYMETNWILTYISLILLGYQAQFSEFAEQQGWTAKWSSHKHFYINEVSSF